MKSLYLNSISLAYEMLDPLFILRRRVLGHSVDFSHSNVYPALLRLAAAASVVRITAVVV